MLRVVCISRGLSACFLLISLGLSISVVSGQTEPGAPDVSFNGEGVPDWPGLLHLLPAAKILINKFPSTIIRLNANGAVDSTFAAEPLAGLEVRAMLGQPDGKVLAGGISSGRGLARLEASGSRDTNFSSVAVSNVWCIALDHEDILVGGGFTEVNGVPRDHVAKLDTRGNLMPAFAPQLGFQTNDATALYSLTDGGVLVGFNLVGSARTSPWVVRLKSDGGIDPGFVPFIPPTNAAVSPDVQINGFALQADGKLLIHGWFQVAGQNGIMRLQSDGSLDTTFRGTCEPASSQVKYLAMQPDGKILIGGNFTSANGFPAPGLARLKPDGEFDVGFAPALAIGSFTLGLALQEDGKILAAGYDATGSPYLRRLLGGDLPPNPPEILQGPSALTLTSGQTGSFSVRARSRNLPSYQWRKDGNDIQGATNAVLAFRAVAATDGGSYQVLVSNEFGTTASASASLEVLPPSNTPGTIDLSFDPGAGTDDEVTTLAVQRDGRILLTGVFQTVDGAARPGIARLEPNGEVDASFNPGSGFKYSTYLRPPTLIPGPDGVFNLLAELQDGRIVAGGYFTNYDGVACPGIVRLESNGRVDTNFVVASGIEGAIVLQTDEKVITRSPLARLDPTGSIDPTFVPPAELDDFPDPKVKLTGGTVTRNGDLLVAGWGSTNNRGFLTIYDILVRLQSDGKKDSAFQAEKAYHKVVELPDGRILAGTLTAGPFAHSGGLIALLPDGRIDHGFAAISSLTNHVETFALQPNGKIIVALGGGYDLSGVFQPGALLRLYPDGRPDPDFAVITNLNTVEAIAIQEDGNVLVAGTFTNINGVVRQRIARVFGGERPGLPEIIFPPVGRTASVGQSVSFAAQVASNPAPGYQWLLNDDPIAGATNRTLVLASVQMTDAGRYSLMVSNRYGNAVSAAALLQVHGASPPAILTPPQSQTVLEGTNVTFRVDATNAAALSYQWERNGTNLIWATNATLILHNVRLSDAGTYQVAVTSELGSTKTTDATLSVTPAKVVDVSFDPGAGPEFPSSNPLTPAPSIIGLAEQADGKWIVLGDFLRFEGARRNQIARLNRDGSLDSSFDPGIGVTGGPWVPGSSSTSLTSIKTVAIQPSGQILIGGAFEMVQNTRYPCLARLNQDGSVDLTFRATGVSGGPMNPFIGGDSATVWTIALQADDKILIGGSFTKVNGVERNYLARLNADGSLDPTFDPKKTIMGSGQPNLDVRVDQFALPADGFIWVRGPLSERVSGSWYHPGVARFKTDGTWDNTIPNPSLIRDYDKTVQALAVHWDGNLLASVSTWLTANGPHQLLKLKPDMTLDPSFKTNLNANAPIDRIATASDGKIVIAGKFTEVSDILRHGLARLNPDGVVDSTFNPGVGPDNGAGVINAVQVDPDGDIMVSGGFTSFDGAARAEIALLKGESPLPARLRIDVSQTGVLALSLPTNAGTTYALEATDLLMALQWEAVQEFTGDGTRQRLTLPKDAAARFYRIRVTGAAGEVVH